MQKLEQIRVKENISIGDDAYLLRFKRNFEFIPGQIIGISNEKSLPVRLYSICSSNKHNEITILYNVKKDGQLTPKLANLKKGDLLWITKPQGKFQMQNSKAWWIATGTGIAPFYAMYKSGYKPLRLVQGARNKKSLFFMDEWVNLPDYVACCSGELDENVFNGRITQYLNSLESLPQGIIYYICGSTEMAVDVRNILISKGISYQNIISEIYF